MTTEDVHARLLSGDPTAPADVFSSFYGDIVDWLRHRFPSLRSDIDPDVYYQAAFSALTSYVENPVQFDPARRGLRGYLQMAAHADLSNLVRKEQRRSRPLAVLDDDVADAHSRGNKETEEAAEMSLSQEVVTDFLSNLPALDRRVADLLMIGERRTSEFGKVMGIEHLPLEEQRRQVKNAKDRLKKRLKRQGAPSHD